MPIRTLLLGLFLENYMVDIILSVSQMASFDSYDFYLLRGTINIVYTNYMVRKLYPSACVLRVKSVLGG